MVSESSSLTLGVISTGFLTIASVPTSLHRIRRSFSRQMAFVKSMCSSAVSTAGNFIPRSGAKRHENHLGLNPTAFLLCMSAGCPRKKVWNCCYDALSNGPVSIPKRDWSSPVTAPYDVLWSGNSPVRASLSQGGEGAKNSPPFLLRPISVLYLLPQKP